MFSANSSQVSDDKLFVEDVFSTYLYTGNSGSQTITNGIDLAGKGGLVWIKARSGSYSTGWHMMADTARGTGKGLSSNDAGAQFTNASFLTSFNSNGFDPGGETWSNGAGTNFASWTFREAPKFFDIVTYTGTGSATPVAHNLGVPPGFIVIKRTDSTSNWCAWHRNAGGTNAALTGFSLNTTAASAGTSGAQQTATTFNPGQVFDENFVPCTTNGATYVAYLYAHDATSDGVIQCGSYTGNGTTTGPDVNLGWEPQWVLLKRATGSTGQWEVYDSMRGLTVGADAVLRPNTSGSEFSVQRIDPTATGFRAADSDGDVNASGSTYIYIAIRRGPMRTPTLGTSVFAPALWTGTNSNTTISGIGFPPDLLIEKSRATGNAPEAYDRLRGLNRLLTSDSGAELALVSGYDITAYGQDGYNLGLALYSSLNFSGRTNVLWNFRRAPGFMDVVCYSGNGVANRSIPHNLGVTPELSITKARKSLGLGDADSNNWIVRHKNDMNTVFLMNSDVSPRTWSPAYWPPTTTWFGASSLNTGSPTNGQSWVNGSGEDYVSYLFASVPGVSKVGSYTGNGSSQTINCDFTTGARFVMIKRMDNSGDWYVWDTARGIVAGNDPHLSLNTTAAEVTTDDSVDTDSSGFVVNQVTAINVNLNGSTYIYLAIA